MIRNPIRFVRLEAGRLRVRRGYASVLKRGQLLARRVFELERVQGRLETPEERAAAMRAELADAKRRIEERTGREVIHLCYPWHAAGPTARRLAREVGYRTAFGGKVKGSPVTRPGEDPHAIARIGEDYLELLPGRGRLTLSAILSRKWSRRLKGRA